MKELIEKIEACGYNEESDLPDEARHFNYGLEKAIAILKAEFEWKDIPDSEGVWKNDNADIVFVTTGVGGLWAIGFFDDKWTKVSELEAGKWCRAITPESEG